MIGEESPLVRGLVGPAMSLREGEWSIRDACEKFRCRIANRYRLRGKRGVDGFWAVLFKLFQVDSPSGWLSHGVPESRFQPPGSSDRSFVQDEVVAM